MDKLFTSHYLDHAFLYAQFYLRKTVSNGLRYPTWILLFDYEASTSQTVYENKYMTVQVDQDDRLSVEQKNGGVVTVPVYANHFLLINIRRHDALTWEFPRGFRETTDVNGIAAAKRELSEELGLDTEAAGFTALGKLQPDSNLLTTDIQVVSVELASKPQDMKLQEEEGIEEYQLVTLAELTGMIADSKIDDGFTLGALALWQAKHPLTSESRIHNT